MIVTLCQARVADFYVCELQGIEMLLSSNSKCVLNVIAVTIIKIRQIMTTISATGTFIQEVKRRGLYKGLVQ